MIFRKSLTMKTYYSLSIPKPCHENWSKMTPNEKGRFCQSCSKTVVDFTNMNTNEVQKYIHNNKHQRICGHIRRSQLDTINLQISETVFEQTMSVHKLFLLALLLAMGTSLLSCADDSGNKKKIESVEIIEKVIDSTTIEVIKDVDSIKTQSDSKEKRDSIIVKKHKNNPPIIETLGMMIIDKEIKEERLPIHPDSIAEPQIEEIEGEIDIVMGMVFPPKNSNGQLDNPYDLFEVDELPKFKETPKEIDGIELKELFQRKISSHCNNNFNLKNLTNIDITGTQKIYTQFTIDSLGNVTNIKVRANHISIENEAIRILKLLPQFVPAKKKGKPVNIVYNLPITFTIED